MVRLSLALSETATRSAPELLDALRFLAAGTRVEPGCLTCSAWMDPDVVYYVEDWVSEADMRRRVRSDHFTSLLAIVESARDPHVRFDFVTLTRGLDYVAEVRNEKLPESP
jgi:quinol monooxygenase YgiN